MRIREGLASEQHGEQVLTTLYIQLNSSLSSLLSSGYRPVIVRSGRRQQGRRLWCGGVAVHVEATAATARDGAVYGAAMTAPTATAVAAVAAVAVAAVAAGRRRGGRWWSG